MMFKLLERGAAQGLGAVPNRCWAFQANNARSICCVGSRDGQQVIIRVEEVEFRVGV